MLRRPLVLPWLALLPALAAVAAVAATRVEPLARIQDAALKAVRTAAPAHASRVRLHAQPLDARLRLAACAQPLQTSLPGGRVRGNRVSVAVACTGPQPWTVRVAVSVHLYMKVLVTTRALARGDHLGAGDLGLVERDLSTLGYGYVTDPAQLAGRALARPVNAGAVLTPAMLAHREVVRRGDRVTIESGSGAVRVRAVAEALGAGDDGQRIRVRNLSSGQVVDATVVGPGRVRALP